MKKLNKFALGLTALMMGFGGNAMAAEQTGTAQVNASVSPSCWVDMSELDDFSINYNPSNEQTTIRSVNVQCTKTTPYEMGLSVGAGGSENSRVMKNGNSSLSYQVNVDRDGSYKVWGDIGSANTAKNIGSGVDEKVSVRFVVPAGQYVLGGTYTDDLVITFNY